MDKSSLKLLLIEDSPADAELAIRAIRKEGFDIEWDRVECEVDLRRALDSSAPNLIISDFSMPTFDGIAALRVAREMAPETPFIFLSGTIGEERAIDAIKRGATDYVLKDNSQRLVPAIRRALHEIEERQRASLLEQEKERLMEMLEATSDYVAVTEADGNIIYLNTAWRKLAGIPTAGPIEKSLYNLLSPDVRDLIREQAIPAAARHGPWHGETSVVNAGGEAIPVSQVVIAHLGQNDTPQFFSTIARDIRERKSYEERISHLANFDAVTDLPNRNLLSDRIEQAIVLARRMNQPLALIIVGIDKFSRLIDSYGHRTGDTLLSLVASRLKGVAHVGDTVAHLGGGSFAILTLDGGREDVLAYLRKMRKAIQENFEIEGREIHCKVNIGVSTFPSDAGDAATLLHNADAAMHRAAESIGEGFQFYAATMTHDALVRVQTERDLRRAFDRGELRVFYQPQIDLVSGQMTGAEALLRWQHQEQEWISPSHFIPVAEDCGLILEIGKLTLVEACQQMTAMEREGIPMARVAVNMSARQFHDPRFLQDVRQILEASDVSPAQLEIELTETVLVQDQEAAISILNELKALGVQIAVDDFGTGYSSLSYLSRLPVDRLKIDCSFIHRLCEHGRDATIVQAIISLAHSLGLSVIAEGVETERQLAFLRHHSCDEAQGFLFAKPMDASALHAIGGKLFLK